MHKNFAAAAVFAFLLTLPAESRAYSQAELKELFQRSVDTKNQSERTRLRTLIARTAPDSAYGLASRAFLLHGRITPGESASLYTKALELDPTIAVAHYNRANDYLDLKQYAKAERGYAGAIDLGFNTGMVYSGLGLAQFYQDKNEEAEKSFTKSLQLDPSQPFTYNNRGGAYHKLGEYDKAIADFNAALKLSRFAMAYMNRGDAWAEKKEFRKALDDYRTAESMIGSDPDLLARRGKIYLKVPDYAAARSEFVQALSARPRDPVVLHGLGNACYYQKDYDCAENAYKRALAADPDNADLYAALATTYQSQKRLDLAEETLKKAVARLPGNRNLRDNLAAVRNWNGGAGRSETSRSVTPSSGNTKTRDYLSRGLARLETKDYSGAEAELKRALRADPGSQDAAVYLALSFLGSGRSGEALELFSPVADTDGAFLAELRARASVTARSPGPGARAGLREILKLYDQSGPVEKRAPGTSPGGALPSGPRAGVPAQEDCYCILYTGGTPSYMVVKVRGAPAACKAVKFRADRSKPGVSGLKNCEEFQ